MMENKIEREFVRLEHAEFLETVRHEVGNLRGCMKACHRELK
jgi:hypothetical protein